MEVIIRMSNQEYHEFRNRHKFKNRKEMANYLEVELIDGHDCDAIEITDGIRYRFYVYKKGDPKFG